MIGTATSLGGHAFTFLLTGVFSVAMAQTEPVELEQVEVVTTPIVDETRVDRLADQTSLIGREQIEALNAQDLTSALRRTPGVTISRYNAVGSFGGGAGGSVLIRGLGSSRPGGEVMMEVDGVPNYNAIFNHPLLDLMSIDAAESIEVSRRANPVASGNSFAGVNMNTPRARAEGVSAQAMISAGSFGMLSEKVSIGFKDERFDFYARQSHRQADGHRPDSDGKLNNYLVHAGMQLAENWELRYVLNRTDNRAVDPGPETGSGLPQTRGDVYLTENWLNIVTAAWDYERAEGWVKAYSNEGKGDWLRRATSGNADAFNDYKLSGVRWREVLRLWEGSEITGGMDYDLMEGTSVSVQPGAAPQRKFGPEKFRLASAYVGWNHTWGSGETEVIPSVGIRYYDHEIFGHATCTQAGLVVRRGQSQWHMSAGRAVKFPGLDVAAFSVVAIPALGQSWRSLGPETLDQYELGWKGELDRSTTIELTLFRNEGKDRYVFVPPPPPPFQFLNTEIFRTQGAELMVTTHPNETLTLFGGLSLLETTPDDLPYAPEWSIVGGATWQLSSLLTLNVDGSYSSSQYAGSQARANGAPNRERVAAYALLNARLVYRLVDKDGHDRGEIFLAGENLLDRDYCYRPGYPMTGIGGTIGVRWKL